jgi:surface antigen
MWLIFRILINLYYKLYRALYFPLQILAKRSFGLIVMGGLLYVLIQFFSADEPEQNLPQTIGGQVQMIGRQEDGNSDFASDLLVQMTPEELSYYSQVYYTVMRSQPTGKAHVWSYYNMHGTLTPDKPFKNNYGHYCRRFDEVLKVHQVQQRLSGIACEKKDGSWCKLKKTDTPICGLSPKRGFGSWWDGVMRDLF